MIILIIVAVGGLIFWKRYGSSNEKANLEQYYGMTGTDDIAVIVNNQVIAKADNGEYSRQRESIKNYLASTTEHPTADTVYMHVKEEFPNISLGTVYRNLNLLTDLGEAVKITTPDGGDRFDGDVRPHNHFFCTCCKRVLDINMDMQNVTELNEIAAKDFDGIIDFCTMTFYGKCGNCIKKS